MKATREAAAISSVAAMLLLASALGGCASSHPALPTRQEAYLARLSKTIVYIRPDAARVDGKWSSSLEKESLGIAARSAMALAGGGVYFPPAIYSAGKEGDNPGFWNALKPYRKELAGFGLEKMQDRNLRQAVSATPMLEKAPLTEHSERLGPRFFHRTTRRANGQATIFIESRVYLATDAKTVGVVYRIHIYLKDPSLDSGARELTATTIQASQPIPYPDKLKHFNMLTAPVTSVLAWRMQILFADDGKLFMGELKQAMQKARWRIADYFSAGTGT